MAELASQTVIVQEEDIFFFCPNCGKSMVIDARAVGLAVDCPNCRFEVEVPAESQEAPPAGALMPPGTEGGDRSAELRKALEVAQNDMQRLSAHLFDVTKRRRYLEKLRAAHIRQMEQISAHMQTIHAAMEGIAAVLREAAREEPADEG